MKIAGRTFVVSGGASGLGRATCLNLVQAGGYVAVLDLNSDMGAEILSELGQEKAKFLQVDVSDTNSIASAVVDVLAWTKSTGKPLGGVVAAAGIGNPAKILNSKGEPFSLANFDKVLSVNLRGTVDLCRQILPHLTSVPPAPTDEGERGVLILVSSIAAFDGQPGQVAYVASKGAIASLTLPLTRDLARYGVRVVTIAPGVFESGMTAKMGEKVKRSLERVMEWPLRAGRPDEFASLVRSVLENGMVNGAVFRLDGGMRMPSKM